MIDLSKELLLKVRSTNNLTLKFDRKGSGTIESKDNYRDKGIEFEID